MDYYNVNASGGEDALMAMFAGLGIFLVFIVIALIALIVVYLVALAKLFKKAGKPGWAAIVPYYNSYVLVEIAGLYWWYFLIAISGSILQILGITQLSGLATIAGMAVNFFVFYNLAKKMHKEPVLYGVLAIFFAPIMVMILGFGSATYDAGVAVSPNGPIGDNKTPVSSDERFCLGCGKKLTPGVKFCQNCGKEVPGEEPAPTAPVTEEVKPEEPVENVQPEVENQTEETENKDEEVKE